MRPSACIAVFGGLLLCAPVHAQTSVTLKTGARVESGRAIAVEDVATVTGEDAERIRAIIVREARAPAGDDGADGWVDVALEDVRLALDAAGVNRGRTALSGSKCEVRFGAGRSRVVNYDENKSSSRDEVEPWVVELAGPATVRTYLAVSLARLYAVTNDDLRLAFDPKDKALLETLVDGKRIDVQPAATGSSGSIPVRIFLFEGDRLAGQQTITVRALVRRQVVTAAAAIERKQAITSERVTTGEQWLSPSSGVPCALGQAVGAVARGRINAGRVITPDLLVAPLAVKRGDLVPVHCLSGCVKVEVKARALADARDGDLIQFRIDGAKNPFTARISGGRAVMVVENGAPTGAEVGR